MKSSFPHLNFKGTFGEKALLVYGLEAIVFRTHPTGVSYITRPMLVSAARARLCCVFALELSLTCVRHSTNTSNCS